MESSDINYGIKLIVRHCSGGDSGELPVNPEHARQLGQEYGVPSEIVETIIANSAANRNHYFRNPIPRV